MEIRTEAQEPGDISAATQLGEARQRMPANMVANIGWLVLNVLVNFFYVPFLIGNLGVAAYGLVPLAASLNKYMVVLTQGFNSSVSRYLTIDLSRQDDEAANETFNTGVAAGTLIAIGFIPIALIIAWLAPKIFDIPIGFESSAQWMIALSLFAFVVTMFASSFAVSSFALHRFDLRFLVNSARLLSEVGLVILLFYLFTAQLWEVGLSIFLASLVFLAGTVRVWRKLTPQLNLSLPLVKWNKMRELLGFSVWILINQVGSLLFLNIDLLMTNILFGAFAAGRYGAIIVFPMTLRSLAATLNGVLAPIIFGMFAQDRLELMVVFSRRAVKYMGLFLALPIGLICGLAEPFLVTWLGPEFSDLNWLLILLVGHLSINLASFPLFSVQVATNNVRTPAVVTLLMGAANVLLALALATWSGRGFISIAAAGAIILTLKNVVFTPLYGAKILDLPWYTYYPSLVTAVIGCLFAAVASYALAAYWDVSGWMQMAIVAIVTSLLYTTAVLLVGINSDDREILWSTIRQSIGA